MTASLASRLVARPHSLVVAIFLALLALSWHRWTGLIVDIGREADVPLRLMNGETLYRDVHYLYLPLSPYLNALVYRLAGAHLDTLSGIGIVFSIALVTLTYRIARKLMPPTKAAVATCLVMLICVFRPSGDSVLPYAFAALQGAVFSLSAVLFLLRFAANKRPRELVLAGLFVGLTGITKQEFAFAAAVTVAASLCFEHGTDLRRLASSIAYAAIPAAAIAVPVYALLFLTIDWRILIEDCHLFLTHLPESLVFYNRWRSGLDRPFVSLAQMAGATSLVIALAALVTLFGDRTRRLRRRAGGILAGSAAATGVILPLSFGGWDGSPIRALPLFLLAVLALTWRDPTRRWDRIGVPGTVRGESHLVFIVATYSLAMLPRVILRVPSGGFSGGLLIPASIVLLAWGLLSMLPASVGRWTGDAGSRMQSERLALGLMVLVVGGMAVATVIQYRAFDYEIRAPRGSAFVESRVGPVVDETLRFIADNTQAGEVIAILPEGSDLAFLSGRRVNFRHEILMPDFMSPEDERQAIDALEGDRVRFVFVVNRPMAEFGAVAFGRDFDLMLGGWIEQNYDLVRVIGRRPGEEARIGEGPFFVKVYRRRPV